MKRIWKPAAQVAAGLVLLDGFVTAAFGSHFMVFLFRWLPHPVHRIPRYFLRWPEWLLRAGAVLQAAVGVTALVLSGRSRGKTRLV